MGAGLGGLIQVERLDVVIESALDGVVLEDGVFVVGELAEIFLTEPARGLGTAFLVEKSRRDAGTSGSRYADVEPLRGGRGADLIEKAAFAGRGAEEPEGAAGREHGEHGVIEVVGDIGGVVDDEEGGGGKAAEAGGIAGDADDAGAVAQGEGEAV